MSQSKAKLNQPVRIFVIIVLYEMAVPNSPTYRSLLEMFAIQRGVEIEVLLFDNTPGRPIPHDLPDWIHYFASSANSGLAMAYNLATEMARARGYRWLLTLDQDSNLPPNLLSEFARLAAVYQDDSRIGAIVPHILSGERTISPNWFVRNTWPRWFPRGYCGIPEKAVYAFNSGSLVRVEALRKIGGYSPLFWLDSCDHYLFRRFEALKMVSYIAGNVEVQHDFSMQNVSRKMSLARYRNALEAGSAFCDMEFGWIEGLGHTSILLRRYLRQLLDRHPREIRRLTSRMIGLRLRQSRARRMKDWQKVQRERINAYGDTSLLLAQAEPVQSEAESQEADNKMRETVSIFAVVVLYKTALDASLTLNTLRTALEQAPQVLRFKTLVYDNSPGSQKFLSPPKDVMYIADPENPGLAKPYNAATLLAKQEGFDWILTLDQDTELQPDFLYRLANIVRSVHEEKNVAAILPRVMQGERLLSPNWFAFDFFVRHFPSDFNGVTEQSGYGFNSAATVRISALEAIGGYSPLFPLDYSDAYLFRKLHLEHYKTYVAGDLIVEHHLSVLNVESMSTERYRNVIATGSAFCDLMRGRLVGAEFTYRLVRSYLGLVMRKDASGKTTVLAGMIKRRVFLRKTERIREWVERRDGKTFSDAS